METVCIKRGYKMAARLISAHLKMRDLKVLHRHCTLGIKPEWSPTESVW